jgi:hypothetical protein
LFIRQGSNFWTNFAYKELIARVFRGDKTDKKFCLCEKLLFCVSRQAEQLHLKKDSPNFRFDF